MRLRPLLLLAMVAETWVAANAQVPAIPDPYFRRDIWPDARTADLFEFWFGGQLRAMGEPVLSSLDDHHAFRSRFRMLVLPTFWPASAIRVDETEAGAEARFVRLNGRGGYAPGRVARQRTWRPSHAMVRELHRRWRLAALTSLSAVPPPRPPGDQTIVMCADGTYFVFELVDASGSHVVARSQCEMSRALWELMRRMEHLPDTAAPRGVRRR
jgi:hypothetical protein